MDDTILLSSGFMDLWVWQDGAVSKGQAWLDLIFMANHPERTFRIKNEFLKLERGTIKSSVNMLSRRWGWSPNKVRGFLNFLKLDNMIEAKYANTQTLIISILDYKQTYLANGGE